MKTLINYFLKTKFCWQRLRRFGLLSFQRDNNGKRERGIKFIDVGWLQGSKAWITDLLYKIIEKVVFSALIYKDGN